MAVTWALRQILPAGAPDVLELFPGDLDMRVVAPILLGAMASTTLTVNG
jgi:hypothetical protein